MDQINVKKTGLTCAIYTLGCKANQADSDSLSASLMDMGFEIVGYKKPADIYIVNTCTVTGKAAYQSRQAIRRFLKKCPGSKVIAIGCDAFYERKTLEGINGIFTVAPDNPLSEILLKISKRDMDGQKKKSSDKHPSIFTNRARPFLKIQDGCDNFCAYCIVPYVRGQLKSTLSDLVVSSIKRLHDEGYYEVVLTGIHIGKYGRDLGGKLDLSRLLEKILVDTSVGRIRLSSVEPDGISGELIDVIAGSGGRICPHLHIPLQSGCDATLQRMGRRYSTRQYKEIITDVRSSLLNVAIGVDVITGFPGETELEFKSTYEFIESLPLTYLHVFSYSERKGTRACKMSGKVDDEVIKGRTRLLRGISVEKRTGYLRSNIGREVNVVFDRGKVDGYWKGVSENYINVLVKNRSSNDNHHRVKLVEVSRENMMGEEVL